MSERTNKRPFMRLGLQLKAWREKLHETLAEVSGAVEIDSVALEKIEQGLERPTEEILSLLLSHFKINDDEAAKTWELAGYMQDKSSGSQAGHLDVTKSVMVVMPMGAQTMYTDMVQVTINDYGVVMTFLQANGGNQPLPVSRVGMSREHAQSIINLLQEGLHPIPQEPKLLAAPKKPTSKKS